MKEPPLALEKRMCWAGGKRLPKVMGAPPGACILSSHSKTTSCALQVFRDTQVQSEMRGETLASLGPSMLHSKGQGKAALPRVWEAGNQLWSEPWHKENHVWSFHPKPSAQVWGGARKA